MNPPTINRSRRERARRLLNRGAELLQAGQAEKAMSPLKQAHRLEPDSVPILLNLGGAYVMAGEHSKAIPLLEQARETEPENAMIWINLGAAYLGNPLLATPEQQMRAIGAFEQALALNPAAPNVHYNLGLIFVDRDDLDLAVAAFERAIQINPLDRDAHAWLDKLQAGEFEEGEDE